MSDHPTVSTDDESGNRKSHGGAVTAKLPNRTSSAKSLSSIAHLPDAHRASDQPEDDCESGHNSDTLPSSSMNASDKEGNTSGSEGSSSGDPAESNFFLNEGSDENDSYFSEENETLSKKIDYINEKQKVLTRVSGLLMRSDEDIYDASLAKGIYEATSHPSRRRKDGRSSTKNSVWDTAKDVLSALSLKAGESQFPPLEITRSSSSTKLSGRKRGAPSPIDPHIDASSVRQISSQSYGVAGHERVKEAEEFLSFLPSVVFGEGQWMAKALVSSAPPSLVTNRPQDYRWKVFSDPLTCCLGLVPPNGVSMQNAVDIQEAIAVTDEARLVTQSTPPFCIVHVNRAFLLLANLQDPHHAASSSLIGRPVESIVKVTKAQFGNVENTTGHSIQSSCFAPSISCGTLQGIIAVSDFSSSKKETPCRFRALPVLDRSRRRRLSRATSRFSCMSHVLIQVLPAVIVSTATLTASVPAVATTAGDDTRERAYGGNNHSKGSESKRHQHQSDDGGDTNEIVGTVG